MPREYQTKRNNPYYIGNRNIYMQILYIIRDYPTLEHRRKELTNDNTYAPDKQADILTVIDNQINAIELVISEMQQKYSKTYTGEQFNAYGAFNDYNVFCYYRSNPKKNTAPCKTTWKRYRAEFVYKLSRQLNYI